jgi:sugar lactone lactonase YvrE
MCRTYVSVFSCLAVLLSLARAAQAQQQHTITTIVGGIPNNVPATQAPINTPIEVAGDSAGNLYTVDLSRNVVYKIDPSGRLTIVAGNGTSGFSGDGGPATSAQLHAPESIFVDGSGNIFIADTGNQRIRKVIAATGMIQTVVGNGTNGFSGDGGPATSAQLSNPGSVFVDGSGNIFVADGSNDRIREVVAATGNIQTVAGNGTYGFSGDGGPATGAALASPSGLFVDTSGNVFISDEGNQRIREVIAATGMIETVAGTGNYGFSGDGGPATSASFRNPSGLSLDASGNIFIADRDNNRIREVPAATGIIQTVAGTGNYGFGGDGGPATNAALNLPDGIFVDSGANIFIPDTGNNRIREVAAATGNIQTVAGNGSVSFGGDGGPATSAQINNPRSIFVDGSNNLFIADTGRIREVSAANGNIQTVVDNVGPVSVYVDRAGNIFIPSGYQLVEAFAGTGSTQTIAGNGYGFCDDGIPPCHPLGDGGPATNADITPVGVYVDTVGNIFIADGGNSGGFDGVREVNGAGIIHTVAQIASPKLSLITGMSVDGAGNAFIADFGPENRIWEVGLTSGSVRPYVVYGNVAGAFSYPLGFPEGAFVDSAGNVFIADTEKHRVLEVDAPTGSIQIVAGNGTGGFSGDSGPATSAEISFPTAVWGDRQGNLLIADAGNNRIRRVTGLVAVVGISIGPAAATVAPNTTQQFTATITNAINTAVTWSLAGTGCTGSGCGTISPQGLYTAPAPSGTPLTVTLTATSVADDTKSATATITVPAKQATSLAVSSSANPSVFGQAVTLTATVSPSSSSSVPTGTVTFSDGANTLGTVPLSSSGTATLTASSLAIAAHPITATYSGDNGFLGSKGSLTENVSYGICPLYDQTRTVHGGANFPIELYLCDAGDNDVSSTAVVLHATQITSASGYSGTPEWPGNANPGGNFRFNAWLGPTGGYIFNLSAAGLAPGTYSLQFTAGSDPVPHGANFAVR